MEKEQFIDTKGTTTTLKNHIRKIAHEPIQVRPGHFLKFSNFCKFMHSLIHPILPNNSSNGDIIRIVKNS